MGEDTAEGKQRSKSRGMADGLPDPVAFLDKAGRITAVNEAWQRCGLEGGAPRSAVGTRYLDLLDLCGNGSLFLPPADKLAEVAAGIEAVRKGRKDRFSLGYLAQGGSRDGCHILLHVAPLPSATTAKGGRRGREVVGSHFELGTDYHEPQDFHDHPFHPPPPHQEPGGDSHLHRIQSLGATILNETEDAVFLCAPRGRILMANAATEKWLGVPPGGLAGKKISEAVPPELGRLFLEQNAETIALGRTQTFETSLATAQGFRTLLVTKGLHRTASGKIKGVFGIARDISELKAMEREIIDTSDKEKQRLGQELHENLCQYLVGISLLGNVLFEDLLKLKLKEAEDARQITSLVKDAIAEVRALAKGLAPMHQEQEEGLIAALQELAEHARAIGKIRCSLRVPRSASFVDETTSMHLFRIAQEAVHNAIKYSQAKRLQIVLSNTRKEVVLSVQDDGIGFNQSDPPKGENSSGLGLHIMKYRSRAIGAELEIRHLPEGGTAIVCTMPK